MDAERLWVSVLLWRSVIEAWTREDVYGKKDTFGKYLKGRISRMDHTLKTKEREISIFLDVTFGEMMVPFTDT